MDPLDREIAAALAVDPSPEFVARVRERIASEPAPSFWRVRRMAFAAGAVAVTLMIVVMSVTRVGRRPDERAFEPRQIAPAQAERQAGERIPRRSVAPGLVKRSRSAPEVLVAANELKGLREMEALVRGGRTALVFADEDPQDAAGPVPVREIAIAPIDIALIEIPANAEGEGQ